MGRSPSLTSYPASSKIPNPLAMHRSRSCRLWCSGDISGAPYHRRPLRRQRPPPTPPLLLGPLPCWDVRFPPPAHQPVGGRLNDGDIACLLFPLPLRTTVHSGARLGRSLQVSSLGRGLPREEFAKGSHLPRRRSPAVPFGLASACPGMTVFHHGSGLRRCQRREVRPRWRQRGRRAQQASSACVCSSFLGYLTRLRAMSSSACQPIRGSGRGWL
jgi:hypothetical protein